MYFIKNWYTCWYTWYTGWYTKITVKKNQIIVYNDVRDAYKFINTLTGKKDVYALFENDLPDTYNE